MIKTTLTNGQRTIDVFTAHFDVDLPEPDDGSIQYSERNAAPFIAAAENPVILIGDLNVVPQHTMPDGKLQLKPLWDIGLLSPTDGRPRILGIGRTMVLWLRKH